jgi:hydrogenase/urease accessory protein HupE
MMKKLSLVGLFALMPLVASAHFGLHHEHSIGAWLLHMMTSWDHLLTLLAVGVGAWLMQRDRKVWARCVGGLVIMVALVLAVV